MKWQARPLWQLQNCKPLQAIFFASPLLSLAPVVSLLMLILENLPNVYFGGRSRRRRRDEEC